MPRSQAEQEPLGRRRAERLHRALFRGSQGGLRSPTGRRPWGRATVYSRHRTCEVTAVWRARRGAFAAVTRGRQGRFPRLWAPVSVEAHAAVKIENRYDTIRYGAARYDNTLRYDTMQYGAI